MWYRNQMTNDQARTGDGLAERIEGAIRHPSTSLAVALFLGAVALFGKTSFAAGHVFLCLAAAVVFVAVRKAALWIRLSSFVLVPLVISLLALFFRPALVPTNVGALTPTRHVLFGSDTDASAKRFQIGQTGPILNYTGAGPAMVLGGDDILIERVLGRVLVSTRIHDRNGALIAELVRNEWKVSPPPATWDRNFSRDAVEVKNDHGDVVLQVIALPDRVQLQGEWYGSGGAVRLVEGEDRAAAFVLRPNAVFLSDDPVIRPIFRYPGDAHLGERI